MDDPFVMGVLEGIHKLLDDRERLIAADWAALQPLGERGSLDQLHYDRPFLNAVNRGDVGVIQRRKHASFAAETRHSIRIPSEFFRNDLDRHLAPEFCVRSNVNLAHSAFADLAAELVMSDAQQ